MDNVKRKTKPDSPKIYAPEFLHLVPRSAVNLTEAC